MGKEGATKVGWGWSEVWGGSREPRGREDNKGEAGEMEEGGKGGKSAKRKGWMDENREWGEAHQFCGVKMWLVNLGAKGGHESGRGKLQSYYVPPTPADNRSPPHHNPFGGNGISRLPTSKYTNMWILQEHAPRGRLCAHPLLDSLLRGSSLGLKQRGPKLNSPNAW